MGSGGRACGVVASVGSGGRNGRAVGLSMDGNGGTIGGYRCVGNLGNFFTPRICLCVFG